MSVKASECGFVVIKLRLDDESHYLMRKNLKWQDISFIGGHVNARDSGSLIRAARRELLEEVPSLRGVPVTLVPLIEELAHGPVYSISAREDVDYRLAFSLVRFEESPLSALDQPGPRTLNVLVSERELLEPRKYKVSSLVPLLHQALQGGLASVPYSWEPDLGGRIRGFGGTALDQQELSL